MSTTRSGDPLVSVRNLRVSFRLDRQTTFEAVKGITFDIPRNTTVALVGESGSGKSVTSLAMLGLLPPENSIVDPASEIVFDGRNIVGLSPSELRNLRGAKISMIFQEPMTSLNPVFTVGYQLIEVLRLHMSSLRAKMSSPVTVSDGAPNKRSSNSPCGAVLLGAGAVAHPATNRQKSRPTANLIGYLLGARRRSAAAEDWRSRL